MHTGASQMESLFHTGTTTQVLGSMQSALPSMVLNVSAIGVVVFPLQRSSCRLKRLKTHHIFLRVALNSSFLNFISFLHKTSLPGHSS